MEVGGLQAGGLRWQVVILGAGKYEGHRAAGPSRLANPGATRIH